MPIAWAFIQDKGTNSRAFLTKTLMHSHWGKTSRSPSSKRKAVAKISSTKKRTKIILRMVDAVETFAKTTISKTNRHNTNKCKILWICKCTRSKMGINKIKTQCRIRCPRTSKIKMVTFTMENSKFFNSTTKLKIIIVWGNTHSYRKDFRYPNNW